MKKKFVKFLIKNFLEKDLKYYDLYSKRDIENIIRETWFRGNRHLLHDDGRNSLFNIYKEFGLLKKKENDK